MEYTVVVSHFWEQTLIVEADNEDEAWIKGEGEGLQRLLEDVVNRYTYPEVIEVEEIAKI